ncbi:MAG TPA: hypothetical protein VE010_19535, partial [Thermoanaerobaculia bacterium]|nr:hypothetical protein [Thermoanaerobaculia bacterium]
LRDTATFVVAATGFTRRNVIGVGDWTIVPSEIDAIDLELAEGAASFTIKTMTGRKRSFTLREEAQQKLGTLYPELFGETDYSQLTAGERSTLAEFHGGFLRKSQMLLAASIAILFLEVATSDARDLHWLAELFVQLVAAVALGGVAMGVLGILHFWFYKKAAEQADGKTAALGSRYRWIFYGILAVVLFGVAVMMFVLFEKGLVTW